MDTALATTPTTPAASTPPAPREKAPEPMDEQDAIKDAYRLAGEIRTLLEDEAKTLRTRLARILQGQKRPEAIRHILAVVRDDGAGSVELKAVVDEFEPDVARSTRRSTRSTRRS